MVTSVPSIVTLLRQTEVLRTSLARFIECLLMAHRVILLRRKIRSLSAHSGH
jgi:hypothetical protein